ncbi:hypothetical protein C9374_009776 [Naegleria lovaniensis]|uniref:Glycosyl hydrolase family 31 C-terminal domain-containing protein n=1 Tax=Naegleria lovaniensis TaxID=51637 RepID=A0AA88H3X4_NAELO|nr:uncharacterized protein C9374_009776 [Naegleria lovaniensis]KAG2393199.1 hypothetical protein C9374_009776 [Naegleria lovaniensis]
MVHAYFPSSSIWYDYYGGQQVSPGTDGYADVNAPLDTMPIHIRGGYIIPKQTPGLSTAQQKFNPYNLVVALDSNQKAQGYLFLDDGESIDSIVSGNYAMISFNSTRASSSQYVIQATPVVNGYTESSKLSMTSIMTLGVQGRSICSLSVNGQPWSWYGFESNIGRLFIQNLSLSLSTSWKIVFETC